jgi:hypothetical protein
MISQEKLKEMLNYDESSGVFTWVKTASKRIKQGSVAGRCNSHGYQVIGIDGLEYKAHRLAWLYVYGYLPESCIDHINCVRSDNRICNLRLASNSQNKLNAIPQRNNSSGFKGVSRHKGRWRVQASVNGKRHHLGIFKDVIEAAKVYAEFAKKNHGEFIRI